MRLLLIVLVLIGSAATVAGTVYKWVDDKGVTHYSDQPHPGAEKVQVDSAQTYSAPRAPQTPASSPAKPTAALPSYSQFEIVQPKNDESFFNTGNVIAVRLRLDPELQAGHSIRIYLDGNAIDGLPDSGDTFQLSNVARGTHTVTAAIVDSTGKQVLATPPATFHLHQTSVLSPGRR